jgi:hypothetical protein
MRAAARLRSQGGKKKLTKKRRAIALTPLTTDEVRRLPKPHAGFAALIDICVGLVHDFPDELSSSDIDVAGLQKDQADATALSATRASLMKELALVNDTLVALNARIWTQETIIYAHGRVAARSSAAVKRAIEPIERFMKHGPRKKPPTTASTSSSSTSTASTAPSTTGTPSNDETP